MLYSTSTVYVYFLYHNIFYGVHNSVDINVAISVQVSIKSEDNRLVDGKGIGRKVIDRLYLTYSSELAGKKFAYDGEKSLYTVGPLPQNNLEFTVVVDELLARRHAIFQISMLSLVLV